MTAYNISELTSGTLVFSAYLLDVMATWANEFTSQVQSVQDINFSVCFIIIAAGISIHIILKEALIIQ